MMLWLGVRRLWIERARRRSTKVNERGVHAGDCCVYEPFELI
jgi:hypothetical protein